MYRPLFPDYLNIYCISAPLAVEDGAVRVDVYHAIRNGHFVKDGVLLVQYERVRDPQEVVEGVVYGHVSRYIVRQARLVPQLT